MADARTDILNRIRRSLPRAAADRADEYAAIRREYRQRGTLNAARLIDLFVDRVRDYGCEVFDEADAEIERTVAQVLTMRGKRRLLATLDLPLRWLPTETEVIQDPGLTYREIDSADGVVTRCALGIAATGTIVIRHGADEGRRALTLIPDYHLCIVFEQQVVETVPEAIRIMSGFGGAPITTISGPSATSDIEMTRIQGVHGPRTLDVILVRT